MFLWCSGSYVNILKKDDTIQFDSLENAKIFKKLYSDLANDLMKKLPIASSNVCTSATRY